MKILAADNLNVDYLNTNLVPVGYNQDPASHLIFQTAIISLGCTLKITISALKLIDTGT